LPKTGECFTLSCCGRVCGYILVSLWSRDQKLGGVGAVGLHGIECVHATLSKLMVEIKCPAWFIFVNYIQRNIIKSSQQMIALESSLSTVAVGKSTTVAQMIYTTH